jgi:hypothetical protein
MVALLTVCKLRFEFNFKGVAGERLAVMKLAWTRILREEEICTRPPETLNLGKSATSNLTLTEYKSSCVWLATYIELGELPQQHKCTCIFR